MKLHNLNTWHSLYLAGVFTTLPNRVFAGAFGLEVSIVSLVIIARWGDCSGTHLESTIDDSGTAHCTFTLLSLLSLTDVCDETEVPNGGGVSAFLSKTLSVGILLRLLTTVASVISAMG